MKMMITVIAALSSLASPHAQGAATCDAYAAWLAHPTTQNLDHMMTVSEKAPWKYAGQNAAGLYSDIRSGAKRKYVLSDERYFNRDCGVQ